MSVRSKRLIGPVPNVGDDFEVVWTVPDGWTAIVKSVRLVNATDDPVVVDLVINGTDWGSAFFWREVVPGGAIVLDSSWWVLESGDVVQLRATVPGGVTLWVSGALLNG